MLPVWRLSRTRYARAVYEACKRHGVTATRLTEYVRGLEGLPSAVSHDVTLGDHETALALDAPVGDLLPGERLLAATVDGSPAGYLFVSTDPLLEVDALERDLDVDGAFLRRVYVAPDCRQRGVAGALVRRACEWASEREVDRATALVGADNAPARALFEGKGFEPRRVRSYVRAGPWSRRWIRDEAIADSTRQ